MSSPNIFYEEKISWYTGRIALIRKKLSLIALLRLVSFSGLALTLYFGLSGLKYALLFLALVLLIAFIGLVILSLRWKDQRGLLEKLLFVNINELDILNNRPNGFSDGQTFLAPENYLDDLDIFGKRSLFHLLNRTTTSHGTEKLADLLKHSWQSLPDIHNYQQAVRTLTPQSDKRQLMTAQGLLKGEKEGNLFGLTDWLESPAHLQQRKWIMVVRWLIILYNISCLLVLAVTGNYRPLLIGVLAGWILTGLFLEYISEQHVLLGKKHEILEQYIAVLKTFNTMEAGDAALLRQLKEKTVRAHLSISRLAQLSNFFDQSINPVVGFILNNLFLYNLNCMIALERWKESNKKLFPEWIDAVGSIECLNSLASFAFNNPDYIYPSPVAGSQLFIETTKMAHPLIPQAESVPNDFTIGHNERLILVTGSNMSGKTTFLRTTGVNLLLAQCGAPVCAASFTFTPMQLLTSLRVSDSLQEHTSYFMAELKKLQQIIRQLQTGQPALVLIDEILRGTNSEDKTHGSEQFIHKLLGYKCQALFATHDLSLGKLEKEMPGQIGNYCFESVIENEELHFNYRLQHGIASNRNASFLMKKMEII